MAMRITLIGSGLVGSSWGVVFSRAGFEATLYDPDPAALEAALELARRAASELAASGLLDGQSAESVLGRLHASSDLARALEGAGYIQESAPERLEVKQALYRDIAALAPRNAVIGSSTSGLPASSFTADIDGRERCLVVHPINPPHLVPLVELVPAPWTDLAAIDRAERLMREVGQVPIRLRREIPGFVVNRLQGALLSEAFRLVEDGVCSAADLDAAVADGLGLRWAFMGPFETIDLNAPGGIADYCRRFGAMYHGFASEAQPRAWSDALVGRVEAERRQTTGETALGTRKAWRDRVLARLVAARRSILRDER